MRRNFIISSQCFILSLCILLAALIFSMSSNQLIQVSADSLEQNDDITVIKTVEQAIKDSRQFEVELCVEGSNCLSNQEIDIVLLLDSSKSMSGDRLESAKE